jgi:SAM-dependent methyltransferase
MYVFDNAAPQAQARLTALAEVFDPGTIRHLEARGVAEGWKCLEVGGGLGTMTRWLAARVGPLGSVLTTDIDTRHLDTLQLPNVEIRRHDVVEDDLPSGAFDIAYTRLVLGHVSDAPRALANLVHAVRPGGWVVVEDFESDPDAGNAVSGNGLPVARTFVAMRQVIAAAGANMRLGRSLPRHLVQAGLDAVEAEGRVLLYRGGSAGAALLRLNFEQLRTSILATGLVTPDEYADDLARLEDPEFEVRSPILWTTWGRKPRS